MALQNVRSLLWRGEDLGGTGAGTRELVLQTQQAAAARPQIQSLAFINSISISAFLGSSQSTTLSGLNRIVHNKSPDYWVTLYATVANGGTGIAVQVPIPPLGMFFVPANMYSSASVQPGRVVINSSWPVPIPLSGTGSSLIPIANATTAVTLDLLSEQ